MKKVNFTLLLVMLSSYIFCQSLTYPIVDTDVNEFYNDEAIITEPTEGQDYYGQDATYSGLQPSYTDNGDGTITDNVTGLMWQQDMGEKMSYAEAVELLKTINLGGYNDWRIPTIKELYSLAYFSGRCMGENVIDKFIDTDYFEQPIGNVSEGEREIDAQTWSKTHYVGLTMNGDSTLFGFNFVDGRLKGYPKYDPANNSAKEMYFRMVRGNESYGINNYTDNGDGTITDRATGLMWQKEDNGNTYNWQEGLSYAENLELAGHSDWRMPNAKELHSIVDYTKSPSATSSPAIDPMFSCTAITDPDGNSGQYGYYWTSSPLQDGPNPYSDAVYICFGKAQGEMNSKLLDVHGAGAQRNDPKSGSKSDFPDFFGPQGDVRYVYNFVRCVRDAGITSTINSTINHNIKLYPNPANKELTISVNGEISNITVDIVNLLGAKVKSYSFNKANFVRLNVSMLENGCYSVIVKNGNKVSTKKLMIN